MNIFCRLSNKCSLLFFQLSALSDRNQQAHWKLLRTRKKTLVKNIKATCYSYKKGHGIFRVWFSNKPVDYSVSLFTQAINMIVHKNPAEINQIGIRIDFCMCKSDIHWHRHFCVCLWAWDVLKSSAGLMSLKNIHEREFLKYCPKTKHKIQRIEFKILLIEW